MELFHQILMRYDSCHEWCVQRRLVELLFMCTRRQCTRERENENEKKKSNRISCVLCLKWICPRSFVLEIHWLRETKKVSERERTAANCTDLIAYSSDSNNENETFQVCVKYRSALLALHTLDGDGDHDNERSS